MNLRINLKTVLFPLFVFVTIILGLLFSLNFESQSQYVSVFGIPIGLFFMIYPAMVKVKMEEIVSSLKDIKSISTMLILNYAISPFVVTGLGYLFIIFIFHGIGIISAGISVQVLIGIILLGVAPCIAMVIVWTDLSHGNLPLAVSFVAWNSIIQVITTPLLVYFIVRTNVTIDPLLILKSVLLYLLTPLVAGFITRKAFQSRAFFNALLRVLNSVQTVALLFTIFVIFWSEGRGIMEYPNLIWMIGIVMLTFYFALFHIGYFLSRKLKFDYGISTSIGYSVAARDFEISIAIAISAFYAYPFVIITTAIGPLLEIPLMLLLVWIQLNREKKLIVVMKNGE